MSDAPGSLVLRYLRRIDLNVERMVEDMLALKIRMTAVEEAVVGINWRLDRHEEFLDRIERRLGLIEH